MRSILSVFTLCAHVSSHFGFIDVKDGKSTREGGAENYLIAWDHALFKLIELTAI